MTRTRSTTSGGRARDGAAAPRDAARPPRISRRAGRAFVAGSLALVSATGGVLVAQTAGAAVTDVPAFPDNIVVFPDRDFVSVEGYSEHAGETATIEVTRGTQVIGSAKALVDGGGVAFEINHPGGFCWGAGTSLQVTPDIQPGDKVTVTFPDGTGGTTTTASGHAADAVLDPVDNHIVTVAVTLGADVNPAQVEQRIVEPALVDIIGKRDVRATPGPLTDSGHGYLSSLEPVDLATGSYLATYQFDDPAAAAVAADAGLGERVLSWQVEDADANRQGLTIAEFGEAGGPGMGGCPLGPGDATPAAGSAIVSRDGASATVKWTPTASAPTASPVVSYTVTATNTAPAPADGRQLMVGSQYPAAATQGVVDGLDPTADYTFQVRAITADGKASSPFSVGTSAGTADPGVPPTLALSPTVTDPAVAVEAATVTASTSAGSTIWYTLETTTPNPVVVGGSISDAAQAFPAEGLKITEQVTVHVAALNAANLIEAVTGTFKPPAAVAPVAPVAKATGGQTSATVTWVPVSGETYTVTTQQNGTVVRPATAATSPFTVANLAKGTYQFVVTATNAAGSTPSAPTADTVITGVVDTLTVARAQWKAGDFRVEGTTSAPAGTVVTLRGTVNGQVTSTTTTVTAGAVVGGPNDYRFRVRAGALATTRPTNVSVSTPGPTGVTVPVTVT